MKTSGLPYVVASVPGVQTTTIRLCSPPGEVTREAVRFALEIQLGLPVVVETFEPLPGNRSHLALGSREMVSGEGARWAYRVTYRER